MKENVYFSPFIFNLGGKYIPHSLTVQECSDFVLYAQGTFQFENKKEEVKCVFYLVGEL